MNKKRRYKISSGFTLTEILVVISIMVVLISVAMVVTTSARTSARVSTTQLLLGSLSQSTALFKGDIGYCPPVLDNGGDPCEANDLNCDSSDHSVLPSIIPGGQLPRGDNFPDVKGNRTEYRDAIQQWWSFTSPTTYLLGSSAFDGYDASSDAYSSGHPCFPDIQEITNPCARKSSFGIRDPGSDGVWGATRDSVGFRNPNERGRVLGPYLDIDDKNAIGRLSFDSSGSVRKDPVTGQQRVAFSGDPDYQDGAPQVICDAWGSPIRYYRRLHPKNSPGSNYSLSKRLTGQNIIPKLSDVFLLRPYTLSEGSALTATNLIGNSDPEVGDIFPDWDGDRFTTGKLQTAEYAYFSMGPDRFCNPLVRSDNISALEFIADSTPSWFEFDNDLLLFESEGEWPVIEDSNKDNIVEIGQ